jgi:FAD/FMN-containing dehydrogenase
MCRFFPRNRNPLPLVVTPVGICDDGLVIDLSGLRYTEVDPHVSTVRVGGGCTWAEVDHATHPFGLAVPSGFVSTTGVGGLTLERIPGAKRKSQSSIAESSVFDRIAFA